MILVLCADSRKLDDDVDPSLLQHVRRSNSTTLEDLRRSHRSGRDDNKLSSLHGLDFSNGGRLLGVERGSRERVGTVLDSVGARRRDGVVKGDADRFLFGKKVEVGLRIEHGVNVAVCGVLTTSGDGVDLRIAQESARRSMSWTREA